MHMLFKGSHKGKRKSGYCQSTSVIRICERCFLCRSMIFCKTCTKCPKCCTKYVCRGQTELVLINVGSLGGQTQSSTNVEIGLYLTFTNLTHNHQQLCTSSQEPLPFGGIASANIQKGSRVVQKSRISGLLQRAIFGPKTKKQMETYTRSEQSQQIPQSRKIQNGDTRNDRDLPTDRAVGHIHRFQGCLFPIPIQNQLRKYLRFHVQGKPYQFKALPLACPQFPWSSL